MPAHCIKGNAFKESKELWLAILVSRNPNLSKARNTIATFRGRPSKPAVVVLYENFYKEFSDNAHVLPIIHSLIPYYDPNTYPIIG